MSKFIKNILFDFDGVIIDSMKIRDMGFRKVLSDYENSDIEKLMEFHRQNGGLSRYVKFRYFYEEILRESVLEDRIMKLANSFSEIMRKELTKTEYLIEQTIDFIRCNHEVYNMAIVSGSDEVELNYLCKELGISDFFIEIKGSPTRKKDLVKEVVSKHKFDVSETILIGDSVNDYDAAIDNGIAFYGFNNSELKSVSDVYLSDFNKI